MATGVVTISNGWLKVAVKPVAVIVQEVTMRVVLKAADLAAERLPSVSLAESV